MFAIIPNANQLYSYNFVLFLRSTSIELEDKQQHLELQIRELMMKDGKSPQMRLMNHVLFFSFINVLCSILQHLAFAEFDKTVFLVSTEEDQTMIGLLTRELVDIVDQRNSLVELLDNDRKRWLYILSSFFFIDFYSVWNRRANQVPITIFSSLIMFFMHRTFRRIVNLVIHVHS